MLEHPRHQEQGKYPQHDTVRRFCLKGLFCPAPEVGLGNRYLKPRDRQWGPRSRMKRSCSQLNFQGTCDEWVGEWTVIWWWIVTGL